MITLDLHGYHLHGAWNEFKRFTDDVYYMKEVKFRVITGHGRIKEELPYWANQIPKIRLVRPARWRSIYNTLTKLHKDDSTNSN